MSTERMDVNGSRTQDIKRLKLSSSCDSASNLKNEPDTRLEKVDSGGHSPQGGEVEEEEGSKGDIALVVQALEVTPFELDGDPAVGLCLIAKRDLKAGEVLFDDTPVCFGPSADLVQDYATPICLGCCVVMNDGNEDNRCSSCTWPICSPDCENMEHHRYNECQLFSEKGVKFPPDDIEIQPCYKAIAIIRGLLLKERNPKMWDQLQSLQWETQLQLTPVPDVSELKEHLGLGDFGEEEDWLRILGIINVNSFSFQRVEKKCGSPSFGECLFPIYSFLCHSCAPNCTWAITYSPEFTMKVRPTVDIKKGELLTVCYHHEFSKLGFHARQDRIRERAEFECKCRRCVDPTDLGTNSGAVKCFKCKEGYMLPKDSSDYELDWNCDKCLYSMCPSFISSFVESLHEQLGCAADEAEEDGVSVDKIYEDFIEANSGVKVHPNHWVIAEAATAIVGLHSADLSKLSMDQVDKFLKLCDYLLDLRNVLAPGFSNERGMLHHQLARGLYRKLELLTESESGASGDLRSRTEKLAQVQKYAVKFWKENPHYDSLIGRYKREPEFLLKEADEIASRLTINSPKP